MNCILPGGCVEDVSAQTENFLTLSYWITSNTGLIHVLAAILCIIIGPVIFAQRKGTKRHIRLGRLFVVLMTFVNISALMTYELGGRPNLFHFFAILNLAVLVPGWLFILAYRKSRKPKHLENYRECMAWAYFGLIAAGSWQIVISLARIGFIQLPYVFLYNGLGALTALLSITLFLWLKAQRKNQ